MADPNTLSQQYESNPYVLDANGNVRPMTAREAAEQAFTGTIPNRRQLDIELPVDRSIPTESQSPARAQEETNLLNFASGRTAQDAVEDAWLTSGPGGGRKSFPTLPAEPSPLDKWNEELLARDITIQTPFGTMTSGGGSEAGQTWEQKLIDKITTPPSLKSQLIPAGIAAGTSLLGAWLGSRSANKAAEIQDRQFQEQMGMLREDRARQRAVEDWEIQVAHEREKQIGGPLKQAQAAAIPGYAEHFGLDLDPEKFVTPDLDPRFTGETRPLTSSQMAPPGYVLDSSGNPVLPSNQQKSSKLSKLLKYGVPAAAIAMPVLGAMGVPGTGWASKLVGSLAGLFRRGGDQQAPASPTIPLQPNVPTPSVSTSWIAHDPTTGLPMNQVLPSTPIQYPGIPTGLPDMGYRRPAPRSYSPFEPQLDRLPLRNE